MEKVRDKYREDITLKKEFFHKYTSELLKKKKMLFDHKVCIQYARKFFTLKVDTYKKNN